METLMATGEPRCSSCGHVQGQSAALPVTGLSEWSRGRREAELAERSRIAALETEIDALRDALAATGVDPFGPTAQWRGGSWCGNESCPCAAPNLPCREWMGCAETGAYCPCCGWNEAAHRIAREAHRRRVQRWRVPSGRGDGVSGGHRTAAWDVGRGAANRPAPAVPRPRRSGARRAPSRRREARGAGGCRMNRPTLHLPLAAAAVVLVVLGLLVASGAGAAEVAPLNVVDRDAYAAGWAAAVQFQTGPLPRPPTDDLTRAQCRWRFDGVNPPAARERRTAFLTGCDDMTTRTDLERR